MFAEALTMPKRGIASFFNSLLKKQRTNVDDQLPCTKTAEQDDPTSSKSHQKRLSPAKVCPRCEMRNASGTHSMQVRGDICQ